MSMTFADAAEEVLKRHSKGAPMHYREITQLARSEGLLESEGLTPEASMAVAIRQDIKRRELASYDQRFRAHDVRATLTVEGLTKVPTAIQVKRWSKNVSSRTVRELRGALGPHERGLIITLSGFTRDAIADASAETRVPISLLNGDRLLDLLMDKEIGVKRRRVTVYELDEEAFSAEEEAEEEDSTVRVESAEVSSLRRVDDRVRTFWPLPGGRKAWKSSLDQMLQFVAEQAPRMVEAVEWMIRNFGGVTSEKVARGYWRVPKSLGMVQTDGERLALTAEGAEYLKDRSSVVLLQIALSKVLGLREVLQYISERPHTMEELLARLQAELGVEWETDTQVLWRVGWLEVLGVARHEGNLWRGVRNEAMPERPAPEPAAETQSKPASSDLLAALSPATTRLYQLLHARILALGPDVELVNRSQYFGYRLGRRTFCSVIPQRKRLRIIVPLEPATVDYPGARDISMVGHWGVGDLELPLTEESQIDQLMEWVQRAARG